MVDNTHDGSIYAAIYGNMDPINIPQMLYTSTMDPMGNGITMVNNGS